VILLRAPLRRAAPRDPARLCTFTTYGDADASRTCREGAYERGRPGQRVRVARARRRLIVVGALLAAIALAGCGPEVVTTSAPTTKPGGPTIGPPPTANGSLTPITIDTTLLAVLPREIDSIPLVESPEGESDAMTDTVLPTIATAAVAAVAVDTSTNDLVYVLVVRLKSGVFTENTFRDWRDSYDEGACLGVSNVLGHADTNIGTHHVFIGTCANGLRTYHTWLEDKQILISASSTGTREFGVLLMGTLRT